MSEQTVRFMGDLVGRLPFLQPVLDEHRSDFSGEVLPHLLMADLKRWAEANADMAGHEMVADLLAYLDAQFPVSSEEVQELIAVSFLEVIDSNGPAGLRLIKMLGPALRVEFDQITGHSDRDI